MKPYTFLLFIILFTGCHKANQDNTTGNPVIKSTPPVKADGTSSSQVTMPDTTTPAAPVTIIGWGDSLTEGTGGFDVTYLNMLKLLSGMQTINKGVGGNTSTQIKNRMVADTAAYKYSVIIWVGRNNYKDSVTVLKDIAAMVGHLGHNRFLILGIINSAFTWERKESNHYAEILGLNSKLASVYGDHFIDIRKYLVASYNPADSVDIKNHLADIPPASLRSDSLHLNAKGYTLVAKTVFTKFKILTKR